MTRSFASHLQFTPGVMMPRFALQCLLLGWTLCVLWTVRAEVAEARLHTYQKLLWRHEPARDRSLRFVQNLGEEKASRNVTCQCETFIQSWKTSHMIRLPMGMELISVNASQWNNSDDYCLRLCREKVPNLTDLEAEPKWVRAYNLACKALLDNDHEARDNQVHDWRSKNSGSVVKGCLQVYARSSVDEIWVPMGQDYRKILSCPSTTRHRRGLTSARKVSSNGPIMNSVDAQTVVGQRPSSSGNKSPLSGGLLNKGPSSSASPLKMLMKQFGMTGPFFRSVMDIFDKVQLREILDTFRLGPYVDRYQRLAEDYAGEFDAGHCFFEYMVYTVFNNRFSLKGNSIERSSTEGSRGIEDDAIGMIMGAATNLLKSENSSQLLTSLFNLIPTKSNNDKNPSKSTSSLFKEAADEDEALAVHNMVPDIKEVALNVARYYLRNYFSTLSGSTVRVDDKDPNNNPDSLADMIEQVSRPVFLSVFGIVPGVPAAGRLDHLLLIASKEKPLSGPSSSSSNINPLLSNALASSPNHQTESRNKLVPLEASFTAGGSGVADDEPSLVKTGNPFFDFGNRMVSTFQRASDATHGLYCVKQYMVNRMWDGFRGTMRRMMRAIPSVG